MIINFKGIVIKPEEVIYFKKMNNADSYYENSIQIIFKNTFSVIEYFYKESDRDELFDKLVIACKLDD